MRIDIDTAMRFALDRADVVASAQSKCLRGVPVSATLLNPVGDVVGPIFVNSTDWGPCTGETGNCGCMHAELKALMWALDRGLRNMTLLCSYSPCVHCGSAIAYAAGPDPVVMRYAYMERYRDDRGIVVMQTRGVEVVCLS